MGFAMQPLGKGPVFQGTSARQLHELTRGLLSAAARYERGNPEAADHRPDPTVVILPCEILPMARHVRPPQGARPFDGTGHGTHRVGIVSARAREGVERSPAGPLVGEPEQDRQHVAENIALLAEEREVDETKIQVSRVAPLARNAQHVVIQQPCAPILREPRGERMEQPVEIVQRLRRMLQSVQLLHEIPERVRVEHESRARHDVGPVAGLVLLQEEEALVLLRQQPLQGEPDAARVTLAQPAAASACGSA